MALLEVSYPDYSEEIERRPSLELIKTGSVELEAVDASTAVPVEEEIAVIGDHPGVDGKVLFDQMLNSYKYRFRMNARSALVECELNYDGTMISFFAHSVKRIKSLRDQPGMAAIQFRSEMPAIITRDKSTESIWLSQTVVHYSALHKCTDKMSVVPRHKH